jgi:hypothetical protein
MKHKIVYLCVLCLLAGLLVLVAAGLSLSTSAPKVTGGIGFMRTNDNGEQVRCWAEFEAQAVSDTLAKGWIKYHDANGWRFRVEVKCLTVLGVRAFFSGPIVSSTDSLYLNKWLLVGVYDGGSPGSKGDKIWGDFYDRDPGCSYLAPGHPSDVESGNLVVH